MNVDELAVNTKHPKNHSVGLAQTVRKKHCLKNVVICYHKNQSLMLHNNHHHHQHVDDFNLLVVALSIAYAD